MVMLPPVPFHVPFHTACSPALGSRNESRSTGTTSIERVLAPRALQLERRIRVGRRERVQQVLVVLGPQCLEDRLDRHLVDGRVEPRALVEDVLNGGALLGEDVRQLSDAARPVAHRNREPDEAAIGGEATLDDAPEHVDVDVAAAQRHHDVLALHVLAVEGTARKQRGEAGGAAALDDHLLRLDQPQHGEGDVLLVYDDHLVHPPPRDGERVRAHLRHRQPVREGWKHRHRHRPPRLQRRRVRRAAARLDPYDLHVRVERLRRERDAGDQAAAAYRHDDGVDVGQLLEQLDADGPGARDDLWVVVAVDVRHRSQRRVARQRPLLSLADVCTADDDVCAKRAAVGHLGHRRDSRHHDRHRHV
mmetsp:Transcript_4027/g.11993  ORF Transcript_4027/g.11993 Transcript_4027/m.11993 type:complete len:362 (+) Transcript_4027:344-1429(+)